MNKTYIYQPLFPARNKGFTLIEVLLAVSIFALLSLLFVGTLDYLISALATQKKSYNQFLLPDLAYQQMKLDISQAINRSVAAKDGNPTPVFFGGFEQGGNLWDADVGLDLTRDFTLFEFTRSGNIAPLSVGYSGSLERVSYVVQNGNIMRYSWPVLDRVNDTIPIPQMILANIKYNSIEFLAEDGLWHHSWQPKPPLNAAFTGQLNINKPPLAIRLKFQLADASAIEWTFWIGLGASTSV